MAIASKVPSKYTVPPPCANNHHTGIAASVPNVPGALGAKPEPNPSARKCTGLLSRNLSVGFNALLLKKESDPNLEGRHHRAIHHTGFAPGYQASKKH